MLSISVKLYRDVVAVLQRVAVARLYPASDPQIHREVDVLGSLLPQNFPGAVLGAIIDHNIIRFWNMPVYVMNCIYNIFLFIVGRNNN